MESQSYECFDPKKTVSQIAEALRVAARRVRAAMELRDQGNTLPFIARYRKDQFGASPAVPLFAG